VRRVALEDSEVCVIPYARLEEVAHRFEPLQQHFHKVMSREIVRDHGVMLMLGSLRAEEKLAAFLLNLSQRLAVRKRSARDLKLSMTRAEIGSFLGLKLETVSRLFTRFQNDGLLQVRQKNVRIADAEGLRKRAGVSC
jgi:CRP/FNR family transcriptional regulator